MSKIILASGSERRTALLNQVGIEHKAVKSFVAEDFDFSSPPQDIVMGLAALKAQDVASRVEEDDIIVIGADTLIVHGLNVLGKPKSNKQAREMLQMLSNSTHEVLTGFAILNKKSGDMFVEYETTKVSFRYITQKEITYYSKKSECKESAGGYAIQGYGAKFVKQIVGEYTNIVGLPVGQVTNILQREFGIK